MSKYFKEIEYNMNEDFLALLDEAREYAGIAFVINSAYRSPSHPESIKNPTSSHIKGLAVDIKVTNNRERGVILDALRAVGFTRIGVAKTFVHVDMDYDKDQSVTWVY